MERKSKTKAQPNISETGMPDINVNMSQINGNMPNGDGQYRNVPDGDTVVIDTKPDIIGVDEIHEALSILNKYKSDRAATDSRISANQDWWRLRNWNGNTKKKAKHDPCPNSAWLVSMLMYKHADAMDAFPSPNIVPVAANDEESAKALSSIIPCILDDCRFKKVWSRLWWDKLISGVGIIGVFWDKSKHNIGDVSLVNIDPLSFYSDPLCEDIQKSRNVFTVERMSKDELIELYPNLADKPIGTAFTAVEYRNDDKQNDDVDTVSVIDWYYKRDGILNYCKFCGDYVLFSSENEGYADGYYAHGLYPFVCDSLYPIKNSPYGFGVVDCSKDTQMYIDSLDNAILKNALANARPRYFIKQNGSVNEDEFSDISNDFVHVIGTNGLGDESLRPIQASQLPAIYFSVLQHKINELKDTAGNNDFSRGNAGAGVTSGSAIAALQEEGNKISRDMLSISYENFKDMCYFIIELIREFYVTERTFRITGLVTNKPTDIYFSGKDISGTPQSEMGIDAGEHVPSFDIKVVPQKSSAFSREIQNQRAQELYQLGFFAPENAQNSLACLAMMDFEGKDKMERIITDNSRQWEMMQAMSAEIAKLRDALGIVTEQPAANGGGNATPSGKATPSGNAGRRDIEADALGETVDKTNRKASEAMRARVQNGAMPN